MDSSFHSQNKRLFTIVYAKCLEIDQKIFWRIFRRILIQWSWFHVEILVKWERKLRKKIFSSSHLWGNKSAQVRVGPEKILSIFLSSLFVFFVRFLFVFLLFFGFFFLFGQSFFGFKERGFTSDLNPLSAPFKRHKRHRKREMLQIWGCSHGPFENMAENLVKQVHVNVTLVKNDRETSSRVCG